jgi:hypothetical protein
MSDVLHREKASVDVSTATDTPTLTPTVTYYQQVATQVSVALNQALSLITSFAAPHTSTTGFVRSHRSIPTEFIATAIAAVESTPELQSVKKFDVNEARDVLQFVDAFRPIVDLIDSLARDLRFTVDARKAKVAADALQIYDIAKGVARDPDSAPLQTHLQNMKRDLGRSRPRHRVKPGTAA